MSDQLKAFIKCGLRVLLIGLLHTAQADQSAPTAAEAALDASRVRSTPTSQVLETAIWSYQKGARQIDLVGVIHLADEAYYQELNQVLAGYDAVFFEMVGNPAAIRALQRRKPGQSSHQGGGINKMYALYQTMMGLSLQSAVIDYTVPNFIHADMSEDAFHQALAAKGENLLSVALGAHMLDLAQLDQGLIMRAMMTGDSLLLKRTLIDLLGTADNTLGTESHASVTITERNITCLSIVEQTHQKHPAYQKTAIFYGAGHLPDFHRRLTHDGWQPTTTTWLPAWQITLTQDQD